MSTPTPPPHTVSETSHSPHAYVPEFGFVSADPLQSFSYLLGPVEALIGPVAAGTRVLDIGCGNGAWAEHLLRQGCRVVGIDVSHVGIAHAQKAHPAARFVKTGIRPDILEVLGEEPFDIVVSTEVIEHLYAPREWAACAFDALRPGGRLVCSTPHHGYLKNLILSITNKWDAHLSPMWDGGHIKFWSRRSLSMLLSEAGFENLRFRGAGRAPFLWMSMVMSGDKPAR